MGIPDNALCLACWHHRREIVLEDEFHVLCVCPEDSKTRRSLTAEGHISLDASTDMLQLLSFTAASNKMDLVGCFLAKLRQTRRREFEQHQETILKHGFIYKRAAWKLRRKPVCRHGVMFTQIDSDGCKCMSEHSVPEDWRNAVFMPALNYEIKTIVAVPFLFEQYTRLGLLQSPARRLGW